MRKFAIYFLGGLLAAAPVAADTLHLDAAKAVELALANNKAIQQAKEKVVEARAGQGSAFGAFLPQVSASGTYTRLAKTSELTMYSAHDSIMAVPVFDPQGNYIGQTGVPVRVPVGVDSFKLQLSRPNNYAVTGTVQQTIFTWGKLLNAHKIAGLSVDLQQEALAQARAQVRVDATQAFYQALLAQKTVGVMADALKQLEGHVGQVQALYDNGLATKLDVMKATLGLQQLEAQVSQIQSAAELALAVLLNTLGAPVATPVALDEALSPDTTLVELAPAIDSALARRPELVQLRDAVKIADAAERIARTANLPNVFAQANFSYKNPVGFTPDWGSDWNATAGISMPIFTGLSNYNKLKAAQSKARQARVALAMVEDGLRLEVQATVSSLNQEAKNTAYQRKNVEVAEAALGLAEQRFQNGLLTNLDYMDSQLALTQSRIAYMNALANYQIAKARLRKAVGEH